MKVYLKHYGLGLDKSIMVIGTITDQNIYAKSFLDTLKCKHLELDRNIKYVE